MMNVSDLDSNLRCGAKIVGAKEVVRTVRWLEEGKGQ